MLKSVVGGMTWPLLPGPRDAGVCAVLFQLERSQWFSLEILEALQNRQLSALLVHAGATVPYYERLFKECGFAPRPGEPVDMAEFARLPLLTRRTLQQEGDALLSRQVPAGHGPVMQNRSSGSTGMPVVCHGTGLSQLFWRVMTERDHLWHRRDNFLRLAIIRHIDKMPPGEQRCLDAAAAQKLRLLGGGPVDLMSIQTDVATQAEWLRARRPENLLSYPSNVAALARIFIDQKWELPTLREVRTIGETIDDEVRELCRTAWGAAVTDMYSAQEIGYMALQCPDHPCYHVQAETVRLEVLNDAGEPCAPGEIGRVVVTVLHNFAMPLIRYEIGDYAEAGGPCACWRGLPVLKRILGRQRNLLTTPDGRRYWPSFPARLWHGIVPVSQVRITQKERDRLEVEYVADRDLDEAESAQFAAALQSKLPGTFAMGLTRVAAIKRSAGGKFEDFVSELS